MIEGLALTFSKTYFCQICGKKRLFMYGDKWYCENCKDSLHRAKEVIPLGIKEGDYDR